MTKRREYILRRHCATEECSETSHIAYRTKRDYNKAAQERLENPWLCSKHENPDAWIRPDNLIYETTKEAAVGLSRFPGHNRLYWLWTDGGLVSGVANKLVLPRFHAESNDFPEGTKLKVTLRVEASLPLDRLEKVM